MRISRYPENLTIAIGTNELKRLREYSEKSRLSMGFIVREALEKWLDEKDQQDGTN